LKLLDPCHCNFFGYKKKWHYYSLIKNAITIWLKLEIYHYVPLQCTYKKFWTKLPLLHSPPSSLHQNLRHPHTNVEGEPPPRVLLYFAFSPTTARGAPKKGDSKIRAWRGYHKPLLDMVIPVTKVFIGAAPPPPLSSKRTTRSAIIYHELNGMASDGEVAALWYGDGRWEVGLGGEGGSQRTRLGSPDWTGGRDDID
jgi:hypothetical protein